jgi:HAD superfamily hydrolase (TIGR01509 family)
MRTVLWDMDGTIANTEAPHFHAWQATMQHYGIEYDYPTFLADFGRNNGEILARLLGSAATPERVREMSRRKEANFRGALPRFNPEPLPGVLDWLERFQAAGVRQVVSSSGTMANIVAIVARLELGDYFMALMSGYTLPRGKPHPALFLNSAAAVGVTPADCIVIEDSLSGVEAARRAGMPCIVVGALAGSPALDRLLETVHGQPCLPAPDLTHATWEQVERLWEQSRSLETVWPGPP